jgi:alkaline phosphatase D
LLGERQLKFLDAWGTKWQGAKMKAVLSQTVFANAAHIHHGKRLIADLDSNGWPQTGRNKALDSIRKSYSFMIGGDQHLATVIHHGIDAWNDSGFSFCVPSIVNYYPRKWLPLETGLNPIPNKQKHTGQFKDGFHNKVTMYAYANPGESEELQDKWRANGKWGKLAAGHGIVRFNKEERTIIMECWPRGVDVTKKDAKQMKGWPIKITQEQNYGRKAAAYLPTIEVSGMTDPVVQVIDETTKKLVYSLRIKGESWTPKVFKTGKYTIKVGNQDGKDKVFSSIEATKEKSNKTLKANF